jgi:hypothetical protein
MRLGLFPTAGITAGESISIGIASNQWTYSLVDKWVELATFTSQLGDGSRRPAGYTEVIQVSPDSGRTWPIVRHLNYTRMLSTNVAQ